VQWSAVVGVQDAPGLEVGDGLLDVVADPVDGGVELDLPVQETSKGCFLIGMIASAPRYPLSPIQGSRVIGVEDPGDRQ